MNQKQSKAIINIKNALDHESHLINGYMSLDRIQRGIEKISPIKTDIIDLVEKEVLAHKDEAEYKRIDLILKLK